MVSKILIIILFTIISAWYDSDKTFVDHKPRFIFRALFVALLSWGNIKEGLLLASIFYLLFDYSYNYFRGNDWNYIGSTAEIDKLWKKYGGWKSQLIFKITIVTLFTVAINYNITWDYKQMIKIF